MKYVISDNAVKILNDVLNYLEEEPDRLDMFNWGQKFNGNERLFKPSGVGCSYQPVPACGTVACLAGTTLLVTEEGRKHLRDKGFFDRNTTYTKAIDMWDTGLAKKMLGLTETQARDLFLFQSFTTNGDGWPERYERAYRAAQTGAERFQVTKERVLHFFETGR